MTTGRPVRLGIGGPVGSGKTALVDALCKQMRDSYQLGVVTNDIFTREDMEFLVRSGALPADRIIGVQTGGCPHTAIREDASMNFDALDELTRRVSRLDLVFLESGGDNLAASFSPELVDASIYVIDVSGGDKIPRKGGPGVTRSDLLVINKIDLAPHVGAEPRGDGPRRAVGCAATRPFVFTNLKDRRRARRGDRVDSSRAALRNMSGAVRERPGLPYEPDTRATSDVGRVARLDLVFACRRGRTVLAHGYAEPPFRIGRLLDVGPIAQMILTCSGPGVFAGDRLQQRVRVERGARVLLVSQAALQLHPTAAADPAWLDSHYEIEDDASLDCFWDPLIPFAGARLTQRIDVAIAAGGELGWSDALMSGRAGRGERWGFSSLNHQLRATVAGSLVYLERYDLAPAARGVTQAWTADRANYLGTTIVRSPVATALRAEAAHHRLRAIDGVQAGVDCLEPRLVVGRLLAESGPPFASARTVLREMFERPVRRP